MPFTNLIPLGKITKPQGLKGAFRLRAFGMESENLLSLTRIFIKSKMGKPEKYSVASVTARKGFYVVKTKRITDINQLLPLVGREVFAAKDDIATLEDGEYYWFELVNSRVVTIEGKYLGDVISVIPTGANDVLQIKSAIDGKEILIPYIDDVVVDVDREKKTIFIKPMKEMI